MIETCYYQETPTQYEVFMMGIHKSMMWLLGQLGSDVAWESYTKKVDGKTFHYNGSVTYEYFPFEKKPNIRPKQQIMNVAQDLINVEPTYGWLIDTPNYLTSLPDVDLNHEVNKIPFSISTSTPKTSKSKKNG